MTLQVASSHFVNKYGSPELTLQVPGRVNIIGEHTDYSGGDVLPFAINKYVHFISKKSTLPYSRITAIDLNDQIDLTTDIILPENHWARYFKSAIRSLENQNYHIGTVDICFKSSIPIGAGVSSSSAITCGFIKLLSIHFNLNLDDNKLIELASIAENNTGVMGGIMDQTAIIKGIKNHASLINCNTTEIKNIKITLPGHQWLLINSGVQHNLVMTDYNNRTQESHQALSLIQSQFPELKSQVEINKVHLDFLRLKNSLLSKRARHFFNEQKRVKKIVNAIFLKDSDKIGQLLFECHDSLQNLYEVSCPEIDFLIDRLKEIDTVKGARIMGGGFGGAVICLIDKDAKDQIMKKISLPYLERFKIDLSSFIAYPSDGLKII